MLFVSGILKQSALNFKLHKLLTIKPSSCVLVHQLPISCIQAKAWACAYVRGMNARKRYMSNTSSDLSSSSDVVTVSKSKLKSNSEDQAILQQLKNLSPNGGSQKNLNRSNAANSNIKRLDKARLPPTSSDSFASMGISEPLQEALSSLNIYKPTEVQQQIIPRLLSRPFDDVLMLSRTGSGKTLAFLVPAFEKIHIQEKQLGQGRTKIGHPRVLILSPTRELSEQITGCIKDLSKHSKVSSIMLNGGDLIGKQRKNLADRSYDIVIASPNRLLEHIKSGAIHLISTHTIIIDEVDTMLTQGFGDDIRDILRLGRKKSDTIVSGDNVDASRDYFNKLQIIAATATMTKAVKTLFTPINSSSSSSSSSSSPNAQVSIAKFNILGMSDKSLSSLNPSRRSMLNSSNSNASTVGPDDNLLDSNNNNDHSNSSSSNNRNSNSNSNSDSNQLKISVVSMSGLHKPLPNVKYEFIKAREYHSKNFTRGGSSSSDDIDSKQINDKIDILVDKLRVLNKSNKKTLVFCNTVKSCRAVMHALETMDSAELHLPTSPSSLFTYHGDLSGDERVRQLALFKTHGSGVSGEKVSNLNSKQNGSSNISSSNSSNSSSSSSRVSRASVLVATDLAARGIDIPMIDSVVLFDFPLNPIDFIHRSGRCGRIAPHQFDGGGEAEYQKGLVVSIVSKRDEVLAEAIKSCIDNELDIEQLTSSKKDYEDHGKYASIMGRMTREKAFERELDDRRLLSKITSTLKTGGSVGRRSRGRDSDKESESSRLQDDKERRVNKERVEKKLDAKHREKEGKRGRQQMHKQKTRMMSKSATHSLRMSKRSF